MEDRGRLAKTVSLTVLVLLLFSSLASVELGHRSAPKGSEPNFFALASSATTTQQGMIELGYDPATLKPANVSLPTYTLGDQMWMLSKFNASVNALLVTPQGSVAANKTVEPDAATPIFSFAAAYEFDGNWTLYISNPIVQNFSIPVTFVNPLSHGMNAVMDSFGFQHGQFAADFSLSAMSPGSYGIQGCLIPAFKPSAIVLNVPNLPGTEVSVHNEGNGSVSISTRGLGTFNSLNSSSAFEFWVELYYQYSYQTTSPSSSFFSTYEEAALTDPVLLSPLNQIAYPALNTLVGMRSGQYELRTFFESGGNLSVEQTSILIQDQSLPWIWLGGCTMSSLNGPTFVATTALTNSSNEWPDALFLSYHVNGITFYLLQPLHIQIDGFTLFVDALQEVPTNIGIDVNVSSGVSETVGESVFVASLNQGIRVNYSLSFGGKVFGMSPPTVYTNASTFVKEGVDLGKITAIVTHDGKYYPNATVTLLNNALNASVTLLSNSNGNATFFGPPGIYTLSASVNGSTVSKNVSLVAAQSVFEQISLDPTSGGQILSPGELEIVVLTSLVAGLGIVGNLWIWVFKERRSLRK